MNQLAAIINQLSTLREYTPLMPVVVLMSKTKEQSTNSLLAHANQCFDQNNIPTALSLFLQYLKSKPADAEVLGKVGAIYLHTDQPTKALDYLEESCSHIITEGKIAYLLRTYKITKAEERGIVYFTSLTDCFDKYLSLYKLYKRRDYELSQQNFLLACQYQPSSIKLLDNIIPLYCDYNFSVNTLNEYHNLYKQHKKSIIISILYANILIKFNNYEQSQQIIKHIVSTASIIDIPTACSLVYTTATSGCGIEVAQKVLSIIIKNNLNLNVIIDHSGLGGLRSSYCVNESTLRRFLTASSKNDSQTINIWPWLPTIETKDNVNRILSEKKQKNIKNLSGIFSNEDTLIFSLEKPDFSFDYLGIQEKEIKAIKEYYSSLYKANGVTSPTASTRKIALFCDRGMVLFLNYFYKVIENLQKNCDLYLICSDYEKNNIKLIDSYNIISFDAFNPSNSYVQETINKIKSYNFSLLYYFECGTTYYNYFCPFFKLARTQITGLGLASTTGIKEIDYIIQPSSLLDDKEQNSYFSEELIYIKNILLQQPKNINTYLEPSGLPDGNLYMLHHSHFKVHYEMDEIIKKICEKDSNAKILIGSRPFYSTLMTLKERLQQSLGNLYSKHIITLPSISVNELCSILRKADVMLDSFYFGSGTTAAEAIYSYLPIVTFPNIKQSHITKVTEEIYKILESPSLTTHCIAHSKEDYFKKATAIAMNKSLKEELSQEIKENIYKLDGLFEKSSQEISDILLKLS